MICRADTVGVFQIESRAQMSMLPRLRPRTFYDLVIEVAIVRPGPIQGGMVHPYLRRRMGLEEVTLPREELRPVLERTMGVPLFQEQAMQLAIVAAGFTPDEADQLRRAMAAWKRKGDLIYRFGERLVEGMLANGYPADFAERCFEQIKGFSEYGFPESHAASFALLVYASSWLKHHHPAAFAAAIINSQPMGFYQPAQLVRDAQEHGVKVLPVDVNHSGWDCTLEAPGVDPENTVSENTESAENAQRAQRKTRNDLTDPGSLCGLCVPSVPSVFSGRANKEPALRLGMRLVKGLQEVEAVKIAAARSLRARPFTDVGSLWRTSGASVNALRALARADAFTSMGLDRQAALWQIRPLRDESLPLFDAVTPSPGHPVTPPSSYPHDNELAALPPLPPGRKVLHDYHALGLSLKAHPMSFLRPHLDSQGLTPCADLRDQKTCPPGRLVTVAGLVLVRQRPGTASGVVFFTIEDETGIANLICWSDTFERYRAVARLSTVLLARGRVERSGEVVHVHVQHLENLDDHIPMLTSASRDFH
jgi:error-prone DNA polymerase